MVTPSSSNSMDRLASVFAALSASRRSLSGFTTLRVVPARPPSISGAETLKTDAEWATSA